MALNNHNWDLAFDDFNWNYLGIAAGGLALVGVGHYLTTHTPTRVDLDLPRVCAQTSINDPLRPKDCDTLTNRLDLRPTPIPMGFYAEERDDTLCYRDGPGDYPLKVIKPTIMQPAPTVTITLKASLQPTYADSESSVNVFQTASDPLSALPPNTTSGSTALSDALPTLLPFTCMAISVALQLLMFIYIWRTLLAHIRRLEGRSQPDAEQHARAVTSLRQQISGITKRMDDVEADNLSQQIQISAVEKASTEHAADSTEQIDDFHTCLNSFQNVTGKFVEDSTNAHIDLKARVDIIERATEANSKAIKTNSVQHVTDSAKQFRMLNQQIASIKERMDKNEASAQKLRSSMEAESKKRAAELTQRLDGATTTIKTMKDICRAKDKVIEELTKRVAAIENHRPENSGRGSAQAIEELVKRVTAIEEQRAEPSGQEKMADTTQTIATLQTQLSETSEHLNALKSQVEERDAAFKAIFASYNPPAVDSSSAYSRSVQNLQTNAEPMEQYLKLFTQQVTRDQKALGDALGTGFKTLNMQYQALTAQLRVANQYHHNQAAQPQSNPMNTPGAHQQMQLPHAGPFNGNYNIKPQQQQPPQFFPQQFTPPRVQQHNKSPVPTQAQNTPVAPDASKQPQQG